MLGTMQNLLDTWYVQEVWNSFDAGIERKIMVLEAPEFKGNGNLSTQIVSLSLYRVYWDKYLYQ